VNEEGIEASRHQGIEASSRGKAGRQRESHPQITQIGRRLFKRILRGREEESRRKVRRN